MIQIIEQNYEEKVRMYMKCTKKELAQMLIESNTQLDVAIKNCNIPHVIGSPILAKIEHINNLGKSKWYEVVYYDDGWYSYAGSKTFEDGEQVIDWKYAKDCL